VQGRVDYGMAHGTAGIALALATLHAATGEKAFGRVAAEAWTRLDDVYDETVGNWSRDAKTDATDTARGWCHGSPGVGIAAKRTRAALGDEAVCALGLKDVLDRTVRRAQRGETGGVANRDHLCCGAFGRLDVMDAAARPRRVTDLVRRARRRGGYRSVLGTDAATMPGLMVGAAGIGVALLRTSLQEEEGDRANLEDASENAL